MKPTVIIVVCFATASVLFVGGRQIYQGTTPADQETSQVVGLSGLQVSTATPSELASPQASQTASAKDIPEAPTVADTVSENNLKLVGLKHRRIRRSSDSEKWTWRVEVTNETQRALNCFVKVEWLDDAGGVVDCDQEVRQIEPGTRSISMVHEMDLDAAVRAKTARVAELQVLSEPLLNSSE